MSGGRPGVDQDAKPADIASPYDRASVMSERTSPQASYGGVPADASQQSGRDLRLDLFRGLSLLFIFIDHIPDNVLSYVTLHSVAFSDAAEVFVFISGYAAAMVYGKALQRQGCMAAAGRIYRRVWQLYAAHILTFVVLAAGVCYATLSVHDQNYTEDFGIDNFVDEPRVAIIKLLLLQYQPQFLDILPIYMIFLGVLPPLLLLLRSWLPLPLVISGVLYLLTLRFGWQPHSYPDDDGWFFNPLAWQFLFVIGATAGYAPYSRQTLPLNSAWLGKLAVGITIAIGIISVSWTIHSAYEAFPGVAAAGAFAAGRGQGRSGAAAPHQLPGACDRERAYRASRQPAPARPYRAMDHPLRPAFAADILSRHSSLSARVYRADFGARRYPDAAGDRSRRHLADGRSRGTAHVVERKPRAAVRHRGRGRHDLRGASAASMDCDSTRRRGPSASDRRGRRSKRGLARAQDWLASARGDRHWPAVAPRSPIGSP